MPSGEQQIRETKRRYPIGAEWIGENQTHVRVWAPKARELDVVVEYGQNSQRTFHPLSPEQGGYYAGALDVGVDTRYWFRVNSGEKFYPDPASRFQPEGPHGPSCIIDPRQFQWTDSQWPGPAATGLKGQIIYEMHIGTFTKEGTWCAATEQLAELARIGITVVETMPIADFPGKFGWGYDGVNLFAPSHLYGTPDDLRAFIDRAHALGVAVILDVVYNHFGPDGNYLGIFSDDYLIREKENEWGNAINFDGPNSGPVRKFFITMGVTGLKNFISMGSASTRHTPFASDPANISSALSDGRRGRKPTRARSSSWPRTISRKRRWRGRAAKAAMIWMGCGTTIFIIAPWWR